MDGEVYQGESRSKVYGEGLARVINLLHFYVEEFPFFNILATGAACLIYAV